MLPIDTAPRDGTPIQLIFTTKRGNIHGSAPRRRKLPCDKRIGKWWSAEDARQRIGKRALEGLRGERIRREGGYWGEVRKSLPISGIPSHWAPLASGEMA